MVVVLYCTVYTTVLLLLYCTVQSTNLFTAPRWPEFSSGLQYIRTYYSIVYYRMYFATVLMCIVSRSGNKRVMCQNFDVLTFEEPVHDGWLYWLFLFFWLSWLFCCTACPGCSGLSLFPLYCCCQSDSRLVSVVFPSSKCPGSCQWIRDHCMAAAAGTGLYTRHSVIVLYYRTTVTHTLASALQLCTQWSVRER